jgi:hypothetical protein
MNTETTEAPAEVEEMPAIEETKPAEGEAKPEGEQKAEEPKPPKTPEQREIERLRKVVDRRTRRIGKLEEALQGGSVLQNASNGATNQPAGTDSEVLSLSRADLDRLVSERAKQLAPRISEQESEIEHRRSVVTALEKSLGKERFDSLAADLNEAFDGLTDKPIEQGGKPKPAVDAIFESENPQALIEYLADPDNSDEAEALSRMNEAKANRAITKLEFKLQALMEAKKAQAKPKPSSSPDPIEPIRGGGVAHKDPSNMTDSEFAAWRRAQITRRH